MVTLWMSLKNSPGKQEMITLVLLFYTSENDEKHD